MNLENVQLVGLCCIIILQYMEQKHNFFTYSNLLQVSATPVVLFREGEG